MALDKDQLSTITNMYHGFFFHAKENILFLIWFCFFSREVPIRLAFSLLVHENVGIFETLLQLLFHPRHSFCVHVDSKAERIVHQAVQNIVKCFKVKFKLRSLDQRFTQGKVGERVYNGAPLGKSSENWLEKCNKYHN